MTDESIQALGDTLAHKDLEKEDVRLEFKIDNVGLKIDYVIDSINGKGGLKEKVDATNGKVRAQQIWIGGIITGSAVFMAMLPVTFFLLKDYFIKSSAAEVVRQIGDIYIQLK